VSEALFGAPPDIPLLRKLMGELDASGAAPHEAAWTALVAAEAIESVQTDRDDYFSRDGQFRGTVFSGIKWQAGWALLVGDEQAPYAQAFDEAGFMVFVTRRTLDTGRFLGERETASIYFAQLLARYALLYGEVEPGARHELTHFVEDHGPGVLVAAGPVGAIEELLCLALMRLGVPAVVAESCPWKVGNRIAAAGPAEAVAATGGFRNLRIRSQEDVLAALPEYANPAYAREKFEAVQTLGGGETSFFSLSRGGASEGVEVVGDVDKEIGIAVTIDDDTLDAAAAQELESAAVGYLNLLGGLRVEDRHPLTLALKAAGSPTGEQMGEVVRRGLRLEYPRLGSVHVAVVGDSVRLRSMAEEAKIERGRRTEEIDRASQAEPDVVYSCESCAPFSREHVCFIHPVRAPMCGRPWTEMLVGARYMGVSAGRPWRRRDRPENCCAVVPLGRCLDRLKGEYEGLNEFVRQTTDGRMRRVFLHSVREHPHSSCSCFYALAWWSDEMGGIGLMQRGFDGVAPDGSTWNLLANRAGGKQQPGITGIALEYMSSPTFLQGDGGWGAVKWMTRKLQEQLRDSAPAAVGIATEVS
jgi:acetyl-CoA decarbonylase/synthase complex subunit beta